MLKTLYLINFLVLNSDIFNKATEKNRKEIKYNFSFYKKDQTMITITNQTLQQTFSQK